MCRKMTSKRSRTFARPFQKPGGGCLLAQVTVVLSKISVNILAPPPPCRTLGQSWAGVRGGGRDPLQLVFSWHFTVLVL